MEENKEVLENATVESPAEETASENGDNKKKKKFKFNEGTLEILVAIMLGITAIFTAWASWIGSLHGGNQATNYTESNNLAADGNSRWNEASQLLMQDMITWNTISDIQIDLAFAEANGDEMEVEKLEWKLDKIINDNCSEAFQDAITWAMDQEDGVSPFDMEGYTDSYFDDAAEVLAQADEILEQGKADNHNGDSFNLVNVIYSLVLFLLGIVGIFKKLPNRGVVFGIAVVAFLAATIYMWTIPMPTDFSIASFFVR